MPAPRTEMWNKMKRLFVLSIMSFILVIFSDTVCTWIIPEEKQSEGRVRFGGGDFTSFIISYYPILGTPPPPPPCCGFLVKVRPCPFIPKCRHGSRKTSENQTGKAAHKSGLCGVLIICIHTTFLLHPTSSSSSSQPSLFLLHVPLFHEWSIF